MNSFASNSGDSTAPSVIVSDVAKRPRLPGHIIAFANEKGGVGKTTLAMHACIALQYSGAKVLAIDLDRHQKSLASTLDIRSGTARALRIDLPSPRYCVLEKQSGALLYQEILRLGSGADFVVLDLAGADSNVARYAISIAETLVTPVGISTFDIAGIGRINQVNRKFSGAGHFGTLVSDIRTERERLGLPSVDWLVLKNRGRSADKRLESQIDESLTQMASAMKFRLGSGFPERLGFRDLLSFGLTYLDFRLIPELGKRRHDIEGNIIHLLEELKLPGFETNDDIKRHKTKMRSHLSRDAEEKYVKSLQEHMSR